MSLPSDSDMDERKRVRQTRSETRPLQEGREEEELPQVYLSAYEGQSIRSCGQKADAPLAALGELMRRALLASNRGDSTALRDGAVAPEVSTDGQGGGVGGALR